MGEEKIGIIGGGNVGQAMAGYLSSLNYDIYLYNRSKNRINDIFDNKNKIKLIGSVNNESHIACVTDNLETVVLKCNVLLITTPADSHSEIAVKIANMLNSNHVVVLIPGRTLGAYKFDKTLQKVNPQICVPIIEANTVFFACRLVANGLVEIYSRKKQIDLSVWRNNSIADNVIEKLINIFPEINRVNSIFITGLSNIGMIFHPAPFLFNLSRVDMGERFRFYKEGISPIIASYIEKIDNERILVAKYLQIEIEDAKGWLNKVYQATGENLYNCIQNTKAYDNVLSPKSIYSRYVFEDISTGLVSLYELGKCFSLSLPYTKQIIELACLVYQEDFYKRSDNILIEDVRKIIEMERK